MKGSVSTFINTWMDAPQSGESIRHMGWNMMELMIPCMAVPLLLVLMTALYLMNKHRSSSLGLK